MPANSPNRMAPNIGSGTDHLSDLLYGKSLDHILKDRSTESILPILVRSIAFYADGIINETELLHEFREFLKFVTDCRISSRPFATIRGLNHSQATKYYRVTQLYIEAVKCRSEALFTLEHIFASELGFLERDSDTTTAVMHLLADLPYIFDNWGNMWVGIMEADWGSIWRITEYLKFLKDGRATWAQDEDNWVSLYLADVAKQGIEKVKVERNRKKCGEYLHEESQRQMNPPKQRAEIRDQSYGKLLSIVFKNKVELQGESPKSSSSASAIQPKSECYTSEDSADTQDPRPRGRRPRPFFYKRAPSPPSSLIDTIVAKYHELPRRSASKGDSKKKDSQRDIVVKVGKRVDGDRGEDQSKTDII